MGVDVSHTGISGLSEAQASGTSISRSRVPAISVPAERVSPTSERETPAVEVVGAEIGTVRRVHGALNDP